MVQGEIPQHKLAAVYSPMVNLILTGSKTMTVGERTFRYDPATYFVMSVDLPAVGSVHPSQAGEPYLAVSLKRMSKGELMNVLSWSLADGRLSVREPAGRELGSPHPVGTLQQTNYYFSHNSEDGDEWNRILLLTKLAPSALKSKLTSAYPLTSVVRDLPG